MSEGIDLSKLNESCECSICRYCFFLKLLFRFQYVLKKVEKILFTSINKIYRLK